MNPRFLLALLLGACAAHTPLTPLPLLPAASEPALLAPAEQAPAPAGGELVAAAELAEPAVTAVPGASEAPVEGVEPDRDPSLDDEKRCSPPERGWGRYQPYKDVPGGRVSLPSVEGLPAGGEFEVYVHFHASDAVRRVFVHEGYPAIFVGVDRGAGTQSYRDAFSRRSAFAELLDGVRAALREQAGSGAKLGRIYLSSWSAGSGATVPLARSLKRKVSALVLLDSLYSSYERGQKGEVLEGRVHGPWVSPVLEMGKRAMEGEQVLFLTHTQVPTHGYASTGEVAGYLREKLGVREVSVTPGVDPRGQVASVDQGGLHLRGYQGSDAKAHCNHLRYAAQAMRAIREKWPADLPGPGGQGGPGGPAGRQGQGGPGGTAGGGPGEGSERE